MCIYLYTAVYYTTTTNFDIISTGSLNCVKLCTQYTELQSSRSNVRTKQCNNPRRYSFKRLKLLALNNNNGNLPVATQISLTRLVEICRSKRNTNKKRELLLTSNSSCSQLEFFNCSLLWTSLLLQLTFFRSAVVIFQQQYYIFQMLKMAHLKRPKQ